MKLSFHGAAGTVTGSCHLIEHEGTRILVDCGFFQGSRKSDEENAADFGFDPAKIDHVVLTHAHLDHCGRLPILVERGFKGVITATDATRELARLVLLDAAHIQQEDARRANRRRNRQGKKPVAPLFGIDDALRALDTFGQPAKYGRSIQLADSISATFHEAGHILGSASVVFEIGRGSDRRRVVFSGDIGNGGRPILPDPDAPEDADYVVMESTYGDRCHRDFEASAKELIEVVARTVQEGGKAIIPTFALERAQELLFMLARATSANELPFDVPVYLDSPMAVSATRIFARHPEAFQPGFRALLSSTEDPFDLPNLRFTRDASESMQINHERGGAIILAGSGMCNGGRVVHHLKHNLWRKNCAIVFVGFAAKGTLARRIIDGADVVDIFGEKIAVRAAIHTINGFSAHADQTELLKWHAQTGKPRRTFLVHGEPEGGMYALRDKLQATGVDVHCPTLHETVYLK
jgi:metallo-beta-lactamase family protein